MGKLLKIPTRFFHDHADRLGDETPAVVKQTARNIWIRADDPHLASLISDAEFYADPKAQDYDFGARALLKAIRKQ